MKKLFACILMFVAVGAMMADDSLFPGWNSDDAQAFTACANATANSRLRLACLVVADMITNPVTTFSDYVSKVEGICEANNQNRSYNIVTFVAYNRTTAWTGELIEYADAITATDCIYKPMIYRRFLNGKARYNRLMVWLKNHNDGVDEISIVNQCLDAVLQDANNDATIETAKDDLSYLNRKYSLFLLDNERRSFWEPIVSKIRTALATY